MDKTQRTNILTIITIGILAFGLQIPFLGFFQDDWNFVFYYSTGGTQGLLDFLLVDGRPGAIWVYVLGFKLLGYSPVLWQAFVLFLRILTVIVFWIILKILFPKRTYGNIIAAIFFLVYPFFTLQPLAVTYSQHFMAYLLYALSILLMIKAYQEPGKYLWYTIPAVLFTFIHLFTVEYFVGLEFLRPLVLGCLIWNGGQISKSKTIRKTIITWFPYLAAFLFFVIWRSFVLPRMGARHDPLEILTDPGQVIFSVINNLFADFILMFISSWFKVLDPQLFVLGPIRNLYYLAITLLGVSCFHLLLKSYRLEDEKNRNSTKIFLTGVFLFFIGMISAYSVGYIVHLKVAPWNSRFVLPALPGLALMSSTLIELLISSPKARHVFLAIVTGLSIGWHNYNTLNFKSAWEKQSRLYEQLTWRAPTIRPGTAIIAGEEILGFMGDYPTSYGINVMYDAKDASNLPLWFFALSENFNFSIDQITDEALNTQRARAIFKGNQQNIIFITYEPENQQCLWVLRPQDGQYKFLPDEMKKAALFSNYQNIQPDESKKILYDAIVSENKETWCYFYQKADLARQSGDWERIIALWQEAQSKDFRPANGFEYIPFIEAYAHLGKWEDAFILTKTANTTTKGMYFILCPTWNELNQETTLSEEKVQFMNKSFDLLRCAAD